MKLTSSTIAAYNQALEDVEGLAQQINKRAQEVIVLIHSAFETKSPISWKFSNAYQHMNNSDTLPYFDDNEVVYESVYMGDWPDLHTDTYNYTGVFPLDFLYQPDGVVLGMLHKQIADKRKQELKRITEAHKVENEDAAIRRSALAKLSPVERASLGYS